MIPTCVVISRDASMAQADTAYQSNTVGSCQVFGDACFSGRVSSIFGCSSSDKITPLYPSCTLCTSAGNVWVTAVPADATFARPDLGQCFFSSGDDMPMTCPDCLNTQKWKHISKPTDCVSDDVMVSIPSLFANPSTTCLQVRCRKSNASLF